jgi:hypothetical protein
MKTSRRWPLFKGVSRHACAKHAKLIAALQQSKTRSGHSRGGAS